MLCKLYFIDIINAVFYRKISKDTPDWCQTYNRFYTEENLESAKKLGRRKNYLKSDIFGNKIHDEKYNKKISFSLIPPPIDSRYVKDISQIFIFNILL